MSTTLLGVFLQCASYPQEVGSLLLSCLRGHLSGLPALDQNTIFTSTPPSANISVSAGEPDVCASDTSFSLSLPAALSLGREVLRENSQSAVRSQARVSNELGKGKKS